MKLLLLMALLAACSQEGGTPASSSVDAGRSESPVRSTPDASTDAGSTRRESGAPSPTIQVERAARTKTLLGRRPLRVGELAWTPDGKLIATCELDLRWGPGQVTFWDARTLEKVKRFGSLDDNDATIGTTGWDTCSIDFSPDGRKMAESRNKLDGIRIWELASGNELTGIPMPRVSSVDFSPDGRTLAATLYDDMLHGAPGLTEVRLVDVKTRRVRRTLRLRQWVTAGWFSADGRRVLVAGGENIIFDANSGRKLKRYAAGSDAWVFPVHSRGEVAEDFANSRFKAQATTVGATSPDKAWAAEITPAGRVALRRGPGGEVLRELSFPYLGISGGQYSLAFDPSSQILGAVTTGHSYAEGAIPESQIVLWDVRTGKALGPGELPSPIAAVAPAEDAVGSSTLAEQEPADQTRSAREWGDECFTLLRIKRYEPARAACKRGLEASRSNNVRGALLYNLGRIAEAQNDGAGAHRYYKRSLEVRPGNRTVKRRLEALLKGTGHGRVSGD